MVYFLDVLNLSEFNTVALENIGTWHYIAEGNSNIVVALHNKGQVVRIPKIRIGEKIHDYDWIRQRKRLEREVNYVNNVIAPLIGSQFIGPVQIVTFSQDKIIDLNLRLQMMRPAHRLHKVLGIPMATCRSDLTRVNYADQRVQYCVEIKPKKGWWDRDKYLSNESPNLCTFCLNQFLKIKLGKVTHRSDYCPLDLFSGDPVRIVTALIALTLNPQNNFRIYRNGKMIYGDHVCISEPLHKILVDWFSDGGQTDAVSTHEIRNRSNLIYLLASALLYPCPEDTNGKAELCSPDLLTQIKAVLTEFPLPVPKRCEGCQPHTKRLPRDCILSRVFIGQLMGRSFVPDIVYKLYHKFCPVHSSAKETATTTCPSGSCTVGDTWLDEIGGAPTPEEVAVVNEYLVGTTVKDCSVMITFAKVNGDELGNAEDLDGRKYHVKIGVADVDPKPVTCIARHFVAEMEMVTAYRQYTSVQV